MKLVTRKGDSGGTNSVSSALPARVTVEPDILIVLDWGDTTISLQIVFQFWNNMGDLGGINTFSR